MPRGVKFDCLASGQTRDNIESHYRAKQQWYKHNKESVWNKHLGPIQGRIAGICQQKIEKLTDGVNEYLQFCRRLLPRELGSTAETLQKESRAFPNDEKFSSANMKPPSEEQRSLLSLGISHDGFGRYGYLQSRYDSGLPETRYFYPPTTNSAYAWKLLDSVSKQRNLILPRRTGTRNFYRVNGAVTKMDYASFHYP